MYVTQVNFNINHIGPYLANEKAGKPKNPCKKFSNARVETYEKTSL